MDLDFAGTLRAYANAVVPSYLQLKSPDAGRGEYSGHADAECGVVVPRAENVRSVNACPLPVVVYAVLSAMVAFPP